MSVAVALQQLAIAKLGLETLREENKKLELDLRMSLQSHNKDLTRLQLKNDKLQERYDKLMGWVLLHNYEWDYVEYLKFEKQKGN